MKTTWHEQKPKLANGPRARNRILPVVASLALAAGVTISVHAAVLGIERSVLLSWPENTADEQIVVGASSVAGPWTPWLEPCFKRHAQLCMAVPTGTAQQYFKLVRGTQFLDDFSDPKQLSATRKEYALSLKDPTDEVTVAEGVMRIARLGQQEGGGVLIEPPDSVVVNDFSSSVDIRSLITSGTNWCLFTIFTRFHWDSEGYGIGCGGGLVLNDSKAAPGSLTPYLVHNVTEEAGPSFDMKEYPPPYRLEFSGVGPNLRLRVLNPTTKAVLREMTATEPTLKEGFAGLYVRGPSNDPTTHEVIVDNFFLTGSKP